MLPDYIDTKQDIQMFYTRWLRARIEELKGPLSEVPQHHIHEGTVMAIIRPNGQEDITSMKPFESGIEINYEDVPRLTLDDILKKINSVAQAMADNIAKSMYETVSEAADSVGNVVRGDGKITPENILEVLEKIEIPFDDRGNPEMPAIHIHPTMAETLKESLITLDKDPELRKRSQDIINRKKEMWRVREASRRLVG